MRKNEFQMIVNFGDTDRAGIVYYPNYFKWFDIATHQFFRSINMPLSKLDAEQNIIVPLLDVGCTFEKALYDDDIITIKTVVSEVNNKTFQFDHEVYRGDVRTGYGHELHGWVKRMDNQLKAVPIPPEIRDILTTNQANKVKQNNPWLSA
ncbi:acyl-CoA thioester hydrolase [Oikeobacillus pervagus]|uniref:Acyl-CoA thioester hydrolase n=1 Tax=Oikeobacillus pervagus TaxID=1325931 RepID=A0AAJ1T2W0_9BACI|nr:thioesterase family protein [Oikeobacillus pervagus]MDQ0214929.1 acyl-CoA thioester hydrolase [Oikeobacillus pervagus]